jgi:hypothetical protein
MANFLVDFRQNQSLINCTTTEMQRLEELQKQGFNYNVPTESDIQSNYFNSDLYINQAEKLALKNFYKERMMTQGQ